MICERTDEQREKQRAYQHTWAAKHRQERRASYRRYRESASGQKVRAAYTDSDAGKAAQRRYDRSAKGKRRHVRSNQQHQARYPDHIRARNAVNGAIRRGKLLRHPALTAGQRRRRPITKTTAGHWR